MTYNVYHNNTSIKLITPLGENTLQFRAMQGHEMISGLFDLNVTFSTTKASLNPQQLMGKSITVAMKYSNVDMRYLNGIAMAFNTLQTETGFFYQVRLQPQLALLQYRINCRIFQNKTVKQIVETILKENGVKNFDMSKITAPQQPLEYCVQYRESDFDFITRLLTNAGIFYFFNHAKDKHTMILADSNQAYSSGKKSIGVSKNQVAGIHNWQRNYHFFSGKLTYGTHDFMDPKKKLQVNAKTVTPVANNTQYEIYDYGRHYTDTSSGNRLVSRHIEALENQYCYATGSSSYPHLNLAEKMSLDTNEFPDEKGNSYVITALTYELQDKTDSSDNYIFHNKFTCIPSSVVFRPALAVRKPVAPSTQLAVITGPSSKEIHTDKYGRMKAQFIWDREGGNNENSSCWMRAVQHWDGLLRVGTPILIGFIDGDMDKPIILGPVYNADMMPLNNLSDQQTQSVLKRRHLKKPNEKKYNEIRFEDKDSAQELSMYASKNMLIEVEQDFKQEVKKGNYILKVKGDITIQAEGAITLDAKKSITINAADDISINTKKNLNLTASASLQSKAGQKLTQKAMEISQQADTKLTSKAMEITQQADVKMMSKAALHNVEASGILTLKGGLIKEN